MKTRMVLGEVHPGYLRWLRHLRLLLMSTGIRSVTFYLIWKRLAGLELMMTSSSIKLAAMVLGLEGIALEVGSFESFVRPSKDISTFIASLTGITNNGEDCI
jgi:hypothetical protein